MAEWLLAQGFGIIKDVISKNMEELLVKDNKELKEKNELIIRIKSLENLSKYFIPKTKMK